jgi:hypothetical protein
VQYAAHGRAVTVGTGGPDPLEHLVDRIGVGEDVVRRFPIGVLIGIAEARHAERRRVGERSAKVGRRRACADRRLERVNDARRIVTEQLSSERRVVRPTTLAAASSEQLRQLAGCFVTQRNEINRLTPRGRFLGATGRHHLADDSRQHGRRELPADQVEALERLVDEVERVPGIGEHALGLSREQSIGQHGRRDTGCDGREQGALDRLAMAHMRPTPQPTLERGRVRSASQRRTLAPRSLAVAVRRHAARAVE